MLNSRVIPCLDIRDGRVVKGTRFKEIRDVGDPLELAKEYCETGADEIVLLDITASREGREPFFKLVERIAELCNIPVTVGGGVRTVGDIRRYLQCGGDKVSLNSVLHQDIDILGRAADLFGSQAVVAALDAVRVGRSWHWVIKGGSEDTGLDAIEMAKEWVRRGAGELLVTSMDRDGTRDGYDLELLRRLRDSVDVPIVASGGAGSVKHCAEALLRGGADAVLVASLFHFREISIPEFKRQLIAYKVPIRWEALDHDSSERITAT
jgi:cyclase